ncbi:hypothetical protein AALP_AAs67613U000100 [Arabis alpina]|uniref:C2H2-type domain-containing protein n=1 Tax=Arabis alpina TaxID=50452 RepID=A0A087FX62_ARAAL|nr:hypothetical protein AALP_AAs67613U000100 [Arabis alpina]
MTTAEMEYQTVKTSVWWDIENCEVPRGWDAHAIAQNIGSALLKKKYSGPVSICACGDTNLIPEGVKQALSSTGVSLNHVPSDHDPGLISFGITLQYKKIELGVKDASDKKILVDMLLWAKDNAAPANLMLISGDRDFSYALHQLRMRRYNILLAQPPQASVPLVAAAKDVWLWTSLASGGPPLTSAESTRLLNNGRGHVSNNEVTKHPVSEQAQSSKTTASTSDAGDAKVHKTRENHVTRGLPQESTRLLNNGRGHVSNNEVTKHPVSEQAESSKSTDTTSGAKDTKDHKTRENHIPTGLTQDSWSSEVQNGRGASGVSSVACDSFAHLSDKRPQAAFVDSNRAQASVSVRPIQEPELVECNVCQIICSSKDTYRKHTLGKRHQNNLELQSVKPKNIVEPVVLPKEVLEKEKKKVSEGAKPKADHVVSQSHIVFDSHLRGKKHASMLSQPEALIDSKPQEKGVCQKDQPKETVVSQKKHLKEPIAGPKLNAKHFCRLCDVVCQSQIVFDSHLRGQKHAAMLSPSEALNDSKKHQEKSIGGKDQPREAIAEPLFQTQNAKEKSKRTRRSYQLNDTSNSIVTTANIVVNDLISLTTISALENIIVSPTMITINETKEEDLSDLETNAMEFMTPSGKRILQKHAAMLSPSEALVDSKKLQEKVVGEMDQPRETIPEPKPNTDHVFDSHLSGQKHAAMMSQSKALNNSRKFEEKVSQEKAQPIETVAENQSQSQNTQENTNFFEKKNEEFREIHGTSESSEKELFPSTKDRVETVNKQLPNGEFFFGDLRCDFDVPREARECLDGIVKPVNLFKGGTEHSGKVKKICNLANEITNVSKRRARPAASKLCNLCVVICDRQGLATVFCDGKGHRMNQKHITAAAFVAGDNAQSSVSTKPVKEPEVDTVIDERTPLVHQYRRRKNQWQSPKATSGPSRG